MSKPKTIMQENIDICWKCGARAVQMHHIIHGTKHNREFSEKEGLLAFLCLSCHEDCHFTHGGYLDRILKEAAQRKYEETQSRDEWMLAVGKNYIMEED